MEFTGRTQCAKMTGEPQITRRSWHQLRTSHLIFIIVCVINVLPIHAQIAEIEETTFSDSTTSEPFTTGKVIGWFLVGH